MRIGTIIKILLHSFLPICDRIKTRLGCEPVSDESSQVASPAKLLVNSVYLLCSAKLLINSSYKPSQAIVNLGH